MRMATTVLRCNLCCAPETSSDFRSSANIGGGSEMFMITRPGMHLLRVLKRGVHADVVLRCL